MAQTLTRLLVHIVFSAKNREHTILPSVEAALYAHIGGVCKHHQSPLLAIGGMADHVHLLVSQSKNIALSPLVMEIKRDSSLWIKTRGDEFAGLHWQDGYSAFTVGESGVERLMKYIGNQKEHHRRRDFKAELIALLHKYKVVYDERYLWS